MESLVLMIFSRNFAWTSLYKSATFFSHSTEVRRCSIENSCAIMNVSAAHFLKLLFKGRAKIERNTYNSYREKRDFALFSQVRCPLTECLVLIVLSRPEMWDTQGVNWVLEREREPIKNSYSLLQMFFKDIADLAFVCLFFAVKRRQIQQDTSLTAVFTLGVIDPCFAEEFLLCVPIFLGIFVLTNVRSNTLFWTCWHKISHCHWLV